MSLAATAALSVIVLDLCSLGLGHAAITPGHLNKRYEMQIVTVSQESPSFSNVLHGCSW